MSDDFRRVEARGTPEPRPVLLNLSNGGIVEHFGDARPTDAASLVEWMDFRDGYLDRRISPSRKDVVETLEVIDLDGLPRRVARLDFGHLEHDEPTEDAALTLQAAGILAVAAAAMAAVVAAFLCYA